MQTQTFVIYLSGDDATDIDSRTHLTQFFEVCQQYVTYSFQAETSQH